ncbi:hypothetical protein LAWI1_G003624 [Lachnellula willkommii]|uniref:AB hydrolase-1 domain-containing protein n=1 Tax=Lachnellula willkommii TaxID=215461 RepID=A0A559MG05_9HELO|nr:hypothetical protein LAWI1_G003624 [Lachnellula willkommii]
MPTPSPSLLLSWFATLAVAQAISRSIITSTSPNSTGLSEPNATLSAGKHATCVTGFVPIYAAASNTNFLFSGPANNFEATDIFIRYTQANSTIVEDLTGSLTPVNGTFNIFSKLCYPSKSTTPPTTVQILTHGGTLDYTYWDIAPNNSYVDAAAMEGSATFSYDRLGTGLSTRPDPIQVVQMAIQVDILHTLAQALRTGRFGGHRFDKVVGVGHSIGAALSQGVTRLYPEDFEAVILSGHSTSFADAIVGAIGTGMQIANMDPSGRFTGLANGYFSLGSSISAHQFAFYKYPHFDLNIFNSQRAISQCNIFGELWTLAQVYVPAPAFTGPVDIVNGQNDFFYCRGDCTYPVNEAALALSTFYPAASNGSQVFLVPNTGHNINAHFGASEAFNHMSSFLKANSIL